jgi:hypothetical protein
MRDPNTVAAIVTALRQVHGDDLARVMLSDGSSLAVAVAPIKNSALRRFHHHPDFGSSHLKYL